LWTGLEWFGGGTISNIHPYDFLFALGSQCLNNRFRNIGTPAVPLVIGTNGTAGICSVSQSTDNEFNRIYISDHRVALANVSSSAYRTRVDNCWAGAGVGGYIPSNDSRLRGVRQTMGTTGNNAIYGAHWADMFTSNPATTGRLIIAANEPSTASAAQCYITAGTPKFTGAGSVSNPSSGDQIVWEMDYFALGYTSLANIDPTITGTLTANMSFEFQWTLNGTWNGTWLALTGANLSGVGAINPATGFKLKVRATTVTPDPTNAITYIRIELLTDATSSETSLYPFKTDATITVGPVVAGSRIYIYNETASTEIYNGIPDGTSLTFAYNNGVEISAGDALSVRVRKKEYARGMYSTIASATGASVLTSQTLTPFWDGTTPTDYTVDFVNKKIRATGTRDEFTLSEIADIIAIEQATEDGIRLTAFANISGLTTLSSGVQIAITVELLGWQISWAAGSVSQAFVTGGNLVGGVLDDPVEDVVGGPQVTINLSASATVVAGGGTAPTAAEVAAAVRVELATELARLDAAISSRLATAGYTTPPTVGAIRAEMEVNGGKLNDARNYAQDANASADAAAINTNTMLDDGMLAKIDGIKAKTDNLPASPASTTNITAGTITTVTNLTNAPTAGDLTATMKASVTTAATAATPTVADTSGTTTLLTRVTSVVPTAAQTAAAVDAVLASTLAVSISSQLSNMEASLAGDISAVSDKTQYLPVDPADQSLLMAAINAIPTPLDSTATQAAAAAALNAYDGPTKAELDAAVAPLATTTNLDSLPTLAEIEGSTVLAKEATVAAKASQSSVDAIPTTPLLAANYTAPANADIAAIKAKTDTLTNTDLAGIATATNVSAAQTAIISAMPAAPLGSVATQAAAAAAITAAGLATAASVTAAQGAIISAMPAAPLGSVATQAAAAAAITAAGLATSASVAAIPTTPLLAANYVAPDNTKIAQIKTKVDSLTNTDLSGVAAQIAGLNDFNPATDVVARVTLVDVTTSNTDMRGTDGAVTSLAGIATAANVSSAQTAIITALPDAPDNIKIGQIKTKVDSLTNADLSGLSSAVAALPVPLDATATQAAAAAAIGAAGLATAAAVAAIPTTPLLAANYVAPDNAEISQLNARLPADPATEATAEAARKKAALAFAVSV
jgi:hypothetical protein